MITNDSAIKNSQLNLSEIKGKKVELDSKPVYFHIDLTGLCNMNPPCVFCTLKSEGYHYNPMNVSYLNKYAEFINRCEKIMDCSFGEPFTHPNFIDLIKETAGKGQHFGFATNGLLLTPSKTDILVQYGQNLEFTVSVNAANSDTYYKLTGQNFDKLIGNLIYFIEKYKEKFLGETPNLSLSFIVMKINREEVSDFIHLAHSLGVFRVSLRHLLDIQGGVKTRNEFGYDFIYDQEMLSYEEYQDVGVKAKKLAQNLNLYITINWESAESYIDSLAEPDVDIPCLYPWKFLLVQEHTKNLYICCYMDMAIDNLKKQSLEEAWNCETLKKMRRSLADGNIPQFCMEHGVNCPLVAEAMSNGQPLNVASTSIDSGFTMGEKDADHLSYGWYGLDNFPPKARWTKQKAAMFLMLQGKRSLFIEAVSHYPNIHQEPTKGHIALNGEIIGDFSLNNHEWNILKFSLPKETANEREKVSISIENPWIPSKVVDSQDSRELGIAVHRVWTE
jgi:MoaA/NifB/PqqE/SkfB family radical SAM enzyme